MPSVILTAPVFHNGAELPPGVVIRDLTLAGADRLVLLGFAKVCTGEPVPPSDTGEPEQTAEAIDGLDEGAHGLSPEEAAEIKNMKKADLQAALTEAGVAFAQNETPAQLREKLMQAWAAPEPDDANVG